MSDENHRILPIFPLPLVQFPGAVTPLHIFEERYRKMLRDVMLTDKMFGITYRSDEAEADASAPPVGSVGCTVEVVMLQTMDDGRSNILCAGGQRYRARGYVGGEPYLRAEVTLFEDEPPAEDLSPELTRAARLFQRVVAANKKLNDASLVEQNEVPDLPEEAQALSFIIAASLELPPEEKQALLELTETAERLKRVTAVLEQAVTPYERRAQAHQISKHNGHGGPLPA
jgi:ATP-dependent Lon protease